jgi:hypothetical protein
MRFINNKPADDTKQSYHMYSPSNQQQQQHQSYHYNHPPQQHHHHQQQQQQQQQHQYYYPPQPPQQLQQSNNNIDLQTVVSKYHANPELLKLILASKVEEDKRRTEEARLRAKELDLYLQNQQELKETTSKTSRNSLQLLQDDNTRRRSSGSSTSSTGSFNNNRRFAPYPLARSAVNCNNNGSMGIPLRRNSSISSSPLLSMNQLSIQSSNTSSPSIPVQQQQQKIVMLSSSAPSSTNQYIYPLPLNSYSSSNNR